MKKINRIDNSTVPSIAIVRQLNHSCGHFHQAIAPNSSCNFVVFVRIEFCFSYSPFWRSLINMKSNTKTKLKKSLEDTFWSVTSESYDGYWIEMKTMIPYVENRSILFFNGKKMVCQHSIECSKCFRIIMRDSILVVAYLILLKISKSLFSKVIKKSVLLLMSLVFVRFGIVTFVCCVAFIDDSEEENRFLHHFRSFRTNLLNTERKWLYGENVEGIMVRAYGPLNQVNIWRFHCTAADGTFDRSGSLEVVPTGKLKSLKYKT